MCQWNIRQMMHHECNTEYDYSSERSEIPACYLHTCYFTIEVSYDTHFFQKLSFLDSTFPSRIFSKYRFTSLYQDIALAIYRFPDDELTRKFIVSYKTHILLAI